MIQRVYAIDIHGTLGAVSTIYGIIDDRAFQCV
jgi:hypothetical protein